MDLLDDLVGVVDAIDNAICLLGDLLPALSAREKEAIGEAVNRLEKAERRVKLVWRSVRVRTPKEVKARDLGPETEGGG
jgi:hypothetical protein